MTEQLLSDGLITVESDFAVPETMDRLAAAVVRAGLLVFARIDHGEGARDVSLELRPTELLIFGHPRGGTPLMMESQQAGIDLPFKALSWEDEDGRVWLAWNDPGWLACRHRLGTASAPAVQAIADGMSSLALAAAHDLSETDLSAAEQGPGLICFGDTQFGVQGECFPLMMPCLFAVTQCPVRPA